MQRQAAAFHAKEDEQRARELLRGLRADNPFADLIPQTKWDQNTSEAKRLLLDAAEKWHVTGSAAEEQRVRDWQKNVKTKAELLASLPVPKATPTATFDPDAWLKEQRARQDWAGEEEQCHEPLRYPPIKWTHRTEFGKRNAGRSGLGLRLFFTNSHSVKTIAALI
jgi:hypothetical protein